MSEKQDTKNTGDNRVKNAPRYHKTSHLQWPARVDIADLLSETDLSYRRVPPKSIQYVVTSFLLVGREALRPHRLEDEED